MFIYLTYGNMTNAGGKHLVQTDILTQPRGICLSLSIRSHLTGVSSEQVLTLTVHDCWGRLVTHHITDICLKKSVIGSMVKEEKVGLLKKIEDKSGIMSNR